MVLYGVLSIEDFRHILLPLTYTLTHAYSSSQLNKPGNTEEIKYYELMTKSKANSSSQFNFVVPIKNPVILWLHWFANTSYIYYIHGYSLLSRVYSVWSVTDSINLLQFFLMSLCVISLDVWCTINLGLHTQTWHLREVTPTPLPPTPLSLSLHVFFLPCCVSLSPPTHRHSA